MNLIDVSGAVLGQNCGALDAANKLHDLVNCHGAILLRDLIPDVASFEAVTQNLCADFHHSGIRQALRHNAGDGYTTEVFRNNFVILGHSEGVCRPYPHAPELCFFMCMVPPVEAGGETTLIDGGEMLAALPFDLRHRLATLGVIYEYLWSRERWQVEFGVADEVELVALLTRLSGVRFGMTPEGLHLRYTARAINRSQQGAEVFCNGILAHLPHLNHPKYLGKPVHVNPTNRVYFGDGSPLSDHDVNALVDAHDQVVYRHRWQANDLLIIDNTHFMHGREMTRQPCERVLVSRFGRRKPGELAS